MKYAGIVLRNVKNSISTVDGAAVFDALLSGGVYPDEIVYLPYNAPSEISAAYSRLSLECDGIFLVCDKVLLSYSKQLLVSLLGYQFIEEYLLETERCLFAVLPDGGAGAEAVLSELLPRIDRRRKNKYSRMVVRTMGAPADKVNLAIKHANEAGKGKIDLHASEKYGDVRIEAVYDSLTPKMTADEVMRIFATELDQYIYALDDRSIAEQLVEALKLHRCRISTAESFTGGGVGQAIVRVPGASAVFYEGLNTYDNGSKLSRLGVNEYTLKQKGAVSDEVAYEMAAGLIADGNCDISVATTGIAGPQSDRSQKPVGLCYIAVGSKDRVRVFRFQLSGDRENITQTAINLALFYAYREVVKK